MEGNKEIFNHELAGVSDAIRLVGELEHIRAHALRSAVVAEGTDDEMFYLILAQQAKELRRTYMQDHFPDIDSKLWCLCKSAATLRQIAYEIWGEKAEQLKEIDNIVDTIWGKATGKDLSECEACRDDKGEVESN
jgi:hypothetical protein